MAKELPINDISLDGGTQPRAELMQHVIDDYAEAWGGGAIFPPVVVYHDGANHWLADGYHRVLSAQKAGLATVPADIRQGSQRDAILYSVGANSDHGVRRTNADKRRAVDRLLNDEEWGKWSSREIAKQCAVSEFMVRSIRGPSAIESQIDAAVAAMSDTEKDAIYKQFKEDRARLVRRGGTTYQQNTGKIGKGGRRSRARDFLEGGEPEADTPFAEPKQSETILLAYDAIKCLKKIPVGDARRQEAFDLVARWIDNNK